MDLPVDPESHKSLTARAVDHVAELPSLVANQGSEEHDPRSLGEREDLGGDLGRGLAADRITGGGIVRQADRREQDTEIVVDLRRGRDR